MWEEFTGPEDIQVGNRFSIPKIWGDPLLDNSIVTEVTSIRSDGYFYWKVFERGREQSPYLVGPKAVIPPGQGWFVQKPFATFKYDPTQAGDLEDDI